MRSANSNVRAWEDRGTQLCQHLHGQQVVLQSDAHRALRAVRPRRERYPLQGHVRPHLGEPHSRPGRSPLLRLPRSTRHPPVVATTAPRTTTTDSIGWADQVHQWHHPTNRRRPPCGRPTDRRLTRDSHQLITMKIARLPARGERRNNTPSASAAHPIADEAAANTYPRTCDRGPRCTRDFVLLLLGLRGEAGAGCHPSPSRGLADLVAVAGTAAVSAGWVGLMRLTTLQIGVLRSEGSIEWPARNDVLYRVSTLGLRIHSI